MKDFDAIGYETQGETGQRYLFKGAGKNAEVIYNAIGMFQTLGYLYNSLWSQSSLKKSYEYFDCEFYFDEDTPLQLTGEVVHEFEDEGTFVYCFDITISDVNETDVDLGFSSIVMETDHDSRVALTDIVGTWALTGSSTISSATSSITGSSTISSSASS